MARTIQTQDMAFLDNLPDKLMTVYDLSRATGIAAGTLGNWRSNGRGPKFLKIGKGIYYDPADIRTWFAQFRKMQSTAEPSKN